MRGNSIEPDMLPKEASSSSSCAFISHALRLARISKKICSFVFGDTPASTSRFSVAHFSFCAAKSHAFIDPAGVDAALAAPPPPPPPPPLAAYFAGLALEEEEDAALVRSGEASPVAVWFW